MTAPPPIPPAGGVPAKKSNVLLWILVGVGGFFALILVAVLAVGFFVVQKAKQAGLDPDLMRRNPALAATKMMTAVNPNVEFVSMDEGKQEITLRDKQKGETFTISFEDAKNGRFKMKSSEGSLTIGGDAKFPAWVPDYPGSNPQGAFSAQGKDGQGGTFAFKTKDSTDKVVKYYQDQFQSSGLKVTSNLTSQNGQGSGGMLVAQDDSQKHTITLLIGSDAGETAVTVTYATNK
jgi:hypothetical protein